MRKFGESDQPEPSPGPPAQADTPNSVRRRYGLPLALAFFAVSWWVWCFSIQADYRVVDSLATSMVRAGRPIVVEAAVVVTLIIPLVLCGAIMILCGGRRRRQRWCVVILLPLATTLMCANVTHTKTVNIIDGPSTIPPGGAEFFTFGLALAIALVGAGAYCVRDVRRERVESAKCRECGYDLRGSVSDVCSECGATRASNGDHGAA